MGQEGSLVRQGFEKDEPVRLVVARLSSFHKKNEEKKIILMEKSE